MKIALIVITLSLMVIPFLFIIIIKGIRNTYKKSKTKFPDRDLLELFRAHNFLLSIKQITQLSPLTITETSLRMQSWVNNGVIRTLYANDGNTMYQLKEKLPDTNKIYNRKNYFEDRSLLEIVLEHIEGTQLNPAQFVWLFDMTLQQARKLLKRLVAANLVTTHYGKSFQRVYISAINRNGNRVEKMEIPGQEEEISADGRLPIDDAAILKLAINHKGRITPTLICIEKKIPLDEAQDVLDNLYEKGAFHIEVDEESGTIEYWLRDVKLYKK